MKFSTKIQKIKRFIQKPVFLKYPAIILINLLFISIFLLILSIIISKATLIEFILTAMPQKQMTGVNILAAGIDSTEAVQRSDTLVVLHVNRNSDRIGIISIPRDTRVKIDGIGITKINHSYAYGKMPLLLKTTSQFLNIPIQYYIQLDVKGLESIIDQIGGVSLDVDKKMTYVDHAGDLFINLTPGVQHLNGKEAVSYIRYRHDLEGDIGRIKRQQKFIKAIFNRLIASKDIATAPLLIRKIGSNFESNLSIREIIGLAMKINRANRTEQIIAGTIPGDPIFIHGISYWQPNIVDTDRIVNTILLGSDSKEATNNRVETKDKTASQETRRKITTNELNRVQENVNLKEVSSQKKIVANLTIEILNGSGNPGIARVLAKRLKNMGFKVSGYGNARSQDYAKTTLVDWKNDVQKAMLIANALNINPAQIIVYNKPNKKIDATIVLGKDWKMPTTKKIKPAKITNQDN